MMDCESDSAVLWEHRFEDLRQWKTKHGDCNVPKAEGKLGRWVVRQRELHKKSKLEPERRQKLDRLGFVWNTNEAAWEHKYALLVKYNETHNHCCVPISDSTLGMWVAKMRANRRRNKLSQHRIDKLNAINFVWNTAETDWMDKYKRLLQFRAVHGHSCVRFNEGELGWWVNTQRQNKRKGKLVPHREALLDEAEFVWAPQEFHAAHRRYEAAQRANAAHGLTSPQNFQYRTASQLTTYGTHMTNYHENQYQNQVTHSPIVPSQGYNSSSPKRRHASILHNNIVTSAGESQSMMQSPTSVKRVKLSTTESSSSNMNWISAAASPQNQNNIPKLPSLHIRQITNWTPYHPSSSSSSSAYTNTKSKETRSDGHSIASLLSPSPKQSSPTSITAPTFQEPEKRSELLSSICGIPRINMTCSPRTHAEIGRGFVLPPITTLRGFDRAKTATDRNPS